MESQRKRKRMFLAFNRPKSKRAKFTDTSESQGAENIHTPMQIWKRRPKHTSLKKKRDKIKSRNIRSKQSLFGHDPLSTAVQEAIDLLPSVLHKLNDHEQLRDFMNLMRLIGTDKFPMHNISFLLLLDVARWFSISNTTMMQYREETMLFFRVGLKLFHGAFIRFMSGEKSEGHLLSGGTPANLEPSATSINFAVPSIALLQQYKPQSLVASLPSESPPGLIPAAIDLKADSKIEHVSYVLSFDGKKVSPGLDEQFGDENLWGYETPKLHWRKERLESDLELLHDTLRTMTEPVANADIDTLYSIILVLSCWIRDMRQLVVKLYFNHQKLMKWAGENWQKSKYLYAISDTQAKQHQSNMCVDALLDVNSKLLNIIASVRGCTLSRDTVDLTIEANVILLRDISEEPKPIYPPHCKQRTEEWHSIRNTFVLTGSVLYDALGLGLLKDQQAHIDKVLHGKAKGTPSADVMKKMQHGTDNEPNAVATLVSTILPTILPGFTYHEEGSHVVYVNNDPLLLVSPDGSLYAPSSDKPSIAVEIKCPYPEKYKPAVHYTLPERYVPQVLAEMYSLDVNRLLFLSWSAQSTTVFMIKFDPILWQSILGECTAVYGQEKITKPTRFREWPKSIKTSFKQFVDSNITFVMEVPSNTAQQSESAPDVPTILQRPSPIVPLASVLGDAENCIRNSFQLSRKQATEVVVWLLSDVDRMWHPEVPHSVPVAYGMKGYSAPVETFRKMNSEVIQACYDRDIHIACTCFDGQFLPLATVDAHGNPLTLVQLQRQVWANTIRLSREEVLRVISTTRVLDGECRFSQGSIEISSQMLGVLLRLCKKQVPSMVTEDKGVESEDTLGYLSAGVLQSHDLDQETQEPPSVPSNEETENTLGKDLEIMEADIVNMINGMKTHKTTAVKTKWSQLSDIEAREKLRQLLESAEAMTRMVVAELDVVINFTAHLQRSRGITIRKSWNKRDKINGICAIFQIEEMQEKQQTIQGPAPTLQQLCIDAIANPKSKLKLARTQRIIKKENLAVIAATLCYPSEYQKWKERAPFPSDLKVHGSDQPEYWFSYPEYSEARDQLEPKCLDSHHLLVNCRTKVCKDGIPGYNINKEAWHRVAEADPSIISKPIVCDLIDKQNNGLAKRTFSLEVQNKMAELNYHNEARFCQLIREWYMADDDRGISALKRAEYRLNLRSFLLRPLDFGHFPPYGTHVLGMSRPMLEGFLQSIDTKTQLYSIVINGSMNCRSISSLTNESFFADMTDMEPTKLGCPKSIAVPRLMSTVTELLHYRHNPDTRAFSMRTAKNPVYPRRPVEEAERESTEKDTSPIDILIPGIASLDSPPGEVGTSERQLQDPDSGQTRTRRDTAKFIDSIVLKDHYFDTSERCRTKQRKAKRDDISKPGAPARGCRTIRSQFYKVDEQSMLPTDRLGIPLQN